MANSVCWYGYVMRRALEFEVEGQRKKEGLRRLINHVEEESEKVGLSGDGVLC